MKGMEGINLRGWSFGLNPSAWPCFALSFFIPCIPVNCAFFLLTLKTLFNRDEGDGGDKP
jgi:hypothetical protein